MKPIPALARVQAEFAAWWRRENRRPLVYASARRPAATRNVAAAPANPENLYLDADTIFQALLPGFRQTTWAGVSFPHYCLVPAQASFFGAAPVFTPDTIWHHQLLGDGDSYERVVFSEQNEFWRKTCAALSRLVNLADGHFFVSAVLGGPLSVLQALRGSAGLCLDLADRPDEVRETQHRILAALRRQHEVIQSVIATRFSGSLAGCFPTWTPGQAQMLECDVSCLFSRAMFEEFVAPEVTAQAEWFDHSIYHLCGPDAARHADVLVQIPSLDGIQWQKGVNGGSSLDWLPLLQAIQKAGKLVYVDGTPGEVLRLSQELEPEGLFLATQCGTAQESEELLERIDQRFGRHESRRDP